MLPLNQIILGDCLEVMKTFPDKSVDLVLTDPPYGLDKRLSSGAGKLKNRKFRLGYLGKSWDVLVSDDYWKEVFRISKNQIIFGGNYYSFPPTRGIICWDKLQPWENFSAWEYAWTSFDKPSKKYTFNKAIEPKRHHPTQKPVELLISILNDFCNGSEIICDPFAGSGSTLVSAQKTGHKWIGIEIDPQYVALANKRLRDEVGLLL